MTQLRRSLTLRDGLAVVVGIMIGSGIFRTPGIVAAQLGRPWLTFVAWLLGGVVAFMGALLFAELGTRLPHAGGKYVYAREAFGARTGFVVGVIEVGIYAIAIAGIAVVAGENTSRLLGLQGANNVIGAGTVAVFTAINLAGVSQSKLIQNIATTAKVLALLGVIVVAFASPAGAVEAEAATSPPTGMAVIAALAVAFQAVIWTYYGYPDAAKIAEEIVEPERSLPRILLGSIATVTALYLLLNAAFLHVLPFEQIATSNNVAADAAIAIVGSRGGMVIAALTLLVVIASISGNVFVTPRVLFAIARDGIGPGVFARISRGGTPWAATLVVGAAAIVLAITGTFERLFGIAIVLVLVIDGATVLSLVWLRRREPAAPFRVPAFPLVLGGFLAVYGALFVVSVLADSTLAIAAGGTLVVAAIGAIYATRRAPA